MSELTVIFPTAALLFVLLLASEYIRTRPLPLLKTERDVHMRGRDHLLAWALAALVDKASAIQQENDLTV